MYPYGKYQLTLPLFFDNGKNVNLCGICLETITSVFPTYPSKEIEKDIQNAYAKSGGNINNLPKLPSHIAEIPI